MYKKEVIKLIEKRIRNAERVIMAGKNVFVPRIKRMTEIKYDGDEPQNRICFIIPWDQMDDEGKQLLGSLLMNIDWSEQTDEQKEMINKQMSQRPVKRL